MKILKNCIYSLLIKFEYKVILLIYNVITILVLIVNILTKSIYLSVI